MKAMLCTRFGGPDDLEFADLPAPEPGAGEVAVAVKAAALMGRRANAWSLQPTGWSACLTVSISIGSQAC